MNIFYVQLFLLAIVHFCHSDQPDPIIWRCYTCYPNHSNEHVDCPRSRAFRKSSSPSCSKDSGNYPYARCKSNVKIGGYATDFSGDMNGIKKFMERICLYKPQFNGTYPEGCLKREVLVIQFGKPFKKHLCDCDSYYCALASIGSTKDSYLTTLRFVVPLNIIYLLAIHNCVQY